MPLCGSKGQAADGCTENTFQKEIKSFGEPRTRKVKSNMQRVHERCPFCLAFSGLHTRELTHEQMHTYTAHMTRAHTCAFIQRVGPEQDAQRPHVPSAGCMHMVTYKCTNWYLQPYTHTDNPFKNDDVSGVKSTPLNYIDLDTLQQKVPE